MMGLEYCPYVCICAHPPPPPPSYPLTILIVADVTAGVTAVAGVSEAMMVGSKGTVSLDSRFDAGYFCTVKVGRHEFQGGPGSLS